MINPYHQDDQVTVYHGDCLDVLRSLPDNSVDSIVTDPPYGLGNTTSAMVAETITEWVSGNRTFLPTGRGFMGNPWDAFVPPVAVWDEAFRVLKPGGHLLAFAGSRTQDLMALAIRLAGFEVRDLIAWIYSSGFPKSLDVSYAIDKNLGHERPDRSETVVGTNKVLRPTNHVEHKGEPVSEEAAQWAGWGTALKPAIEPITVARKPLVGTVAENVLEHGVGGINVDGCRVGESGGTRGIPTGKAKLPNGKNATDILSGAGATRPVALDMGRWPTNIAFDPEQAAIARKQAGDEYFPVFRHVTKAGQAERPQEGETMHPTVKPVALMSWLVRLVTPRGGTVLEPFAGSGTTAEACIIEGFKCIAIEREEHYLPLIVQRLTRPIETVLDLGEI